MEFLPGGSFPRLEHLLLFKYWSPQTHDGDSLQEGDGLESGRASEGLQADL